MSIEEKLINLVRENEFLYNRELINYRNNALKDTKWREIAGALNVDVIKAKQRWKSLRDRFMREQTRFKVLGETGKKSVITWKYFKNLQFLKVHAKRRSLFKEEVESDMDFSVQNESTEMCNTTMTIDDHNQHNQEHTQHEQPCVSFDGQGNFVLPAAMEARQTTTAAINSQYSTVAGTVQKENINIPTSSKGAVKELLSEKIEEQIKRLVSHMIKGQEEKQTHPTTPAQAFFHAMAIQIEHAQLPMSTWFALQNEIMQLINNTITALNPE